MYAFLRRPKWLVAHLLVAVLLVTFVAAGLWQLSRHRERSDRNDAVASRSQLPALGAADLGSLEPEDDEFRAIELRGTWASDDAVLIRNRSLHGAPGCHVAAPLDVPGSTDLFVTLGWLPDSDCLIGEVSAALRDQLAEASDVEVTGRLREAQTRGRFGPRDAAEGRLATLARTDVERIDAQVPLELASMYAELVSASPAPEGPVPLDPPPSDSGPHLGYAVQWFLFFAVGAIGYPIALRHQAHRGHLDDPDEFAVGG